MKAARLVGVALLAFGLSFVSNSGAAEAQKQAFDIPDFFALERLGESQLSPDGKWVVYVQRSVSLEKNQSAGQIWLVPSSGGAARQVTFHEKGASRPRWSPDGKIIAFLSSRSGSQQVWLLSLEGGEPRQLTSLSYDVDNHSWSPTGRHLAFAADVFPEIESDSISQAAKQKEVDGSGVKAEIFDSLLFRRWKDWRHGKRTHTFVYSVEYSEARDLSFSGSTGAIIIGGHGLGGGEDEFSENPLRQCQTYTLPKRKKLGPNEPKLVRYQSRCFAKSTSYNCVTKSDEQVNSSTSPKSTAQTPRITPLHRHGSSQNENC